MDSQSRNGSIAYDMSLYTSQGQQIQHAYSPDGSPVGQGLSGFAFTDGNDQGSMDENDPKRRRIARVSTTYMGRRQFQHLTRATGMRYVSQKEGAQHYVHVPEMKS
jgi:hypothetical protein